MPSKSLVKLNERNVVDIVLKIVERQKLQLLYSSDGKEYITPKQLEKEILALLEENGGRLGLVAICSHLSVNFDVVENAANLISQKSEIQIINGALMTPAYMDSVVEEISEILNDQGLLVVSESSNKYGIPLDFLKKAIQERMHLLPDGSQLSGNTLQTQTFADRQVCKIRGFMRSITKPVPMSQLTLKLNCGEQLLKATIERLLKDSQLKGKINKGVFVPSTFADLQQRTIQSFFQQNQYVEYSLLAKMQIQQPAEQFLSEALGNEVDKPLFMDKFAISDSLYNSIKSQIEQVARDGLFLNLVELLPDCVKTAEDTQSLLAQINAPMRLLSDEVHLVSEGFLNKCLQLFVKPSEERAAKNLKGGMRPTRLVEKEKILQQHKEQEKQKKSLLAEKKRSGKRGKKQHQEDEDEKDKEGSQHICMQHTPFKPDLMRETFEHANQRNLLTQEIDELIMDPLIAFLEEPVAKQFWSIFIKQSELTSTKSTAQSNAGLEQDAEAQFQLLKYICKQFDNVMKRCGEENEESVEQMLAPIKVHLCKVQLTELLNKLITIQAFHSDINLQTIPEAKQLTKGESQWCVSSVADRALVVKKFQAHIKEIFVQLGACVQEKRFHDFFDYTADNIKNLAVRLGKQGAMDKKVEKSIKQRLLTQFEQPVEEWMQSKEAEGLPEGKTDSQDVITALKKVTSLTFNWTMVLQGFYLGLSSDQVLCEEWAIRTVARLITLTNPDKQALCTAFMDNLFNEQVDAQEVHSLLGQFIKTFSQ